MSHAPSPVCSPPTSPPISPPPVPRVERERGRKSQKHRTKGGGESVKQEKPPDELIVKTVEEERSDKRIRVIKELLESEKAHVHALDIVVERYMRPLMISNSLPPSTIRAIFSNLELIRNWNQTFLAALEAHLECGDTFGDLFMEMIPFMRQLYTQYNENYDHAMVTHEKAKKNRVFAQFLEKTQKDTNEQKDLLTYLYLPVQRMLAYDSLLKDILDLTPVDHPDYTHLSNSLNALRDIELSATLRAEQRKNINKVLQIQNSLSDDIHLALPHRRFVYEGDVIIVHGKSYKERHCYLFNDLFVCCKSKRKKLDFKDPLETIIVEDLPDDEDFRYLFRLTSSANEYAISSPDKHHWMALIHSCKKELKELKSEKEREELSVAVEESSRENLISRIVTWSRMKDSSQVLTEIKDLASILEKYKTLNGLQPNFTNSTYSPI